jgi:nucleoside-diphosphate-sugar epimerase
LSSRIVVLGASGFVGRRVLHHLTKTGWAHPVAVSRHASGLRLAGVETLDVDVSNNKSLAMALSNAVGVVNCVAGSPELIVSTTRAVLEIASGLPLPPRIVHFSSLAAYGSATGVVDETSPLRGDLDNYSAAKAQTDRLAGQYRSMVVLRPGIVYGPGSSWWTDRIARLLVRKRLGDLGGAGDGNCNLVFVEDVAIAAVRALRLSSRDLGAYNLGWPAPLTWNAYFEKYAGALDALPMKHLSRQRLLFETRLLAPILKVFEMALLTQSLARWNPVPPLRPWLPALCGQDIRMDVSRAESALALSWTPLDVGLRLSADWFQAGGRTGR